MSDPSDVVSVERLIPAPADRIFDLLADPARHQEIDGSGTVRDAKAGSQRLALGSRFGMSMKLGVPYSMASTVVEFDQDRLIAWQTKPHGLLARFGGGRIWRYELEPAPDGATLVRESWDISQESAFSKPAVKRMAKATASNMAATLERIEQVVTA